MSLINISHDLTPLYEIDSSMFLLYQYVKSVLSIFQKSFSDEKDLSIDDILEDDNSSIQETYSLFMLESLPKCEELSYRL